jgi:hypothetical protein
MVSLRRFGSLQCLVKRRLVGLATTPASGTNRTIPTALVCDVGELVAIRATQHKKLTNREDEEPGNSENGTGMTTRDECSAQKKNNAVDGKDGPKLHRQI